MGAPHSREVILFGARGNVKIFRLPEIKSYMSVPIETLAIIPLLLPVKTPLSKIDLVSASCPSGR